jgi:hypothetical protein
MTWVYLHLVTNHFPIILTLLGTIACGLGAARHHKGMWRYGVVTLAIGGLTAIPTWITGNQAHYVVEIQLGIPEGKVEPHELLSEATMWVMLPMAGLASFAWWRGNEEPRRGPSPPWVRPALLCTALVGCTLLGVTAFLGGRIEHGDVPRPTAADSAARAPQSFAPVSPETLRAGERNRKADSRDSI